MKTTPNARGVKALAAALACAEAAVISAKAALADLEGAPELITPVEAMQRYGIAQDGLLAAEARGELTLSRGSRGRILVSVSDLETWMRCRARPIRRALPEIEDHDEYERRETAALMAMGQGK